MYSKKREIEKASKVCWVVFGTYFCTQNVNYRRHGIENTNIMACFERDENIIKTSE